MKIGMSLGMRGQRGLTQIQRAIALLRTLGSAAHVWLPGANGVSVASLPSNNYLLSDGSTGYSTVDGVVGLTLDGMGALSSTELIGAYPTAGYWSLYAVGATFDGTTIKTFAISDRIARPTIFTAGRLYRLTVAFTATGGGTLSVDDDGTGGGLGSTTTYAGGLTGSTSLFFVATASNRFRLIQSTVGTLTITSLSFKEYTGTHLTQATTANKPLVRRGMFNELLNSATPATQSVTCIAAPYTLALYGTGNVVLSGTGAGTLTGTGASDLVVLNFTPTAGSVTFTKAGTVSSFGLFKGTWTAAQILAAGGIPVTTTAAASNPDAGKYSWAFDGSNDSLALGSVPFQMGDDWAVVAGIANTIPSGASWRTIYGQDSSGSARFQFYVRSDTGYLSAYLRDDAGISTNISGTANLLNARAVCSILKRGSVLYLRVNGVQVATTPYSLGTTTFSGATVGKLFVGADQFAGDICSPIVIKGTVSDADLLVYEKLAASAAGITI